MIKPNFTPPWWLRNRHIQSCFPAVFQPVATIPVRWEELSLPDGDFIDLAWCGPKEGPLVILLHGMEGSIKSHYIQAMLDVLIDEGMQTVTMHFRSCSGRINRKSVSYNGGDTRDLKFLVERLRERFPNRIIMAIGFSLGANVLLRYLALHPDAPLARVVAVSTPFELAKCADAMPMFYQWNLLKSVKNKVAEKMSLGYDMPVDKKQLRKIRTIWRYDELLTVPLFGYHRIEEYYEEQSSRHMLFKIEHPVLILHAEDDPLVPVECIPHHSELAKNTILEVSNTGGHLGFVHGLHPWRLNYWLTERVIDFLRDASLSSA